MQTDRAAYWLGVGAQPSDGVIRLLKKANLVDAEGKAIPQTTETAAVAA
jgi:small subunit ribosomal protein S16